MSLRAPRFWRKRGFISRALAPFGYLYGRITTKRAIQSPQYVAPSPVICIGNLTLGGTGKTPTAIWLATAFTDQGQTPAILSRGYGGNQAGPLWVTPEMDAKNVGDEPVLLANFSPVMIAHDRAKGAQKIIEARPEVTQILMDDGFQNPALGKSFSLLVIDADQGFGNGRVFPAGPLREPIESGLLRAHAALLIGKGEKDAEIRAALGSLPVFRATLSPIEMGINWTNQRVFAFAGIGMPEKFFSTLRSLGADVVEARSFGDHQAIPEAILSRMLRDARAQDAKLITTEKDAARLPKKWQGQILTLPVRLTFHGDDDTNLLNLINRSI